MRSTKENKKTNRNLILVILLCVIALSATIGGTIAWLTKTDKLTNSFVVGTFEVPTTDPVDSSVGINIDGHLYEPSWDDSITHKIIPGSSYAKDPYVGIGAGSEDAVVYVYVENNFSTKVYFTVNPGWEMVGDEGGFKEGTTARGMFKYTAGLTGNPNSDVWTTTPLFNEIVVDESADYSDLAVGEGKKSEIVVSSFIHQAKDADGNPIDESIILEAAMKAFGIN